MRKLLCLLLLFFSITFQAQIVNIESLRLQNDSNGIHGQENLTFSITRNTNRLISIQNNLALQAIYNKNQFLLLNDIGMVFSDDTDFERKGFVHLRYNYELSEKLIMEAFSQYQTDIPLRIEKRWLLGLGPRIIFMEQDSATLVGGSILMYEYDAELNNAIVHRDLRLSNYISASRRLKNFGITALVYYQPRINYWADFRLSGQLRLDWKIFRSLKFLVNGGMYYDAFPVDHSSIPKLTYKISNGLSYSF